MLTITVVAPTEPSLRNWYVVSTGIASRSLILECSKSGARGVVKDPSAEEWAAAFYAPSNPYMWTGGESRIQQS